MTGAMHQCIYPQLDQSTFHIAETIIAETKGFACTGSYAPFQSPTLHSNIAGAHGMTNVSIIGKFNPDDCPSGIIGKIAAVSARPHPVAVSAIKFNQTLLETVVRHT